MNMGGGGNMGNMGMGGNMGNMGGNMGEYCTE